MALGLLDSPQAVQARLESIEGDLAMLQNSLEKAAMDWFRAKRDREKAEASAFLTAKGTDTARRMLAKADAADIGAEEEGKFEGGKARLKVLETRANIGMALLKSQGRI